MGFGKPGISFALVLISTLLVGCNGSSSSDKDEPDNAHTDEPAPEVTEPPAAESVSVAGYAVKGVISNGIITAWSVSPDGQLEPVEGSARTDTEGRYELTVPAGTDFVRVEVSA